MKFVIFGAGLLGKSYYELFKDKFDIVCFADSDPKKYKTKLFDLSIIKPDEIIDMGLNVIITSNYYLEIAQQLYAMGIKEFYIPNNYGAAELSHIDLRSYGEIKEIPNKICIIGHYNAGAVSKALSYYNPYDDIEVVLVRGSRRDSEYFYHYLSSSLIVTQSSEQCGNKKSIELWHGFTIKALYFMSQEVSERSLSISKNETFKKSQRYVRCRIYIVFLWGIALGSILKSS